MEERINPSALAVQSKGQHSQEHSCSIKGDKENSTLLTADMGILKRSFSY